MRSALFPAIALFSALLCACSESFTDPRDGTTYKVIRAGTQTWMAENLAYAIKESYCPEGDERNCSKFGRLYNWTDAQKICPEGWHLPDSAEFAMFLEQAGGPAIAGYALKSTDGWFKKGNGSDDFGFKAIPAGFRKADGSFDGIGGYAYFWSASESPDGLAYYLFLDFSSKSAGMNAFPKDEARSVRCVLNK